MPPQCRPLAHERNSIFKCKHNITYQFLLLYELDVSEGVCGQLNGLVEPVLTAVRHVHNLYHLSLQPLLTGRVNTILRLFHHDDNDVDVDDYDDNDDDDDDNYDDNYIQFASSLMPHSRDRKSVV